MNENTKCNCDTPHRTPRECREDRAERAYQARRNDPRYVTHLKVDPKR